MGSSSSGRLPRGAAAPTVPVDVAAAGSDWRKAFNRRTTSSSVATVAARLQRMNEFIALCQKLELPILVGTDMALPGQPLVDDFDADPMLPHAPEFLSGAQVMLGHTLLVHYAQFGYCSAAAEAEFPARKARNAFFARIGALRAPNAAMRERLTHAGAAAAYTLLRDSAAKGKWLP